MPPPWAAPSACPACHTCATARCDAMQERDRAEQEAEVALLQQVHQRGRKRVGAHNLLVSRQLAHQPQQRQRRALLHHGPRHAARLGSKWAMRHRWQPWQVGASSSGGAGEATSHARPCGVQAPLLQDSCPHQQLQHILGKRLSHLRSANCTTHDALPHIQTHNRWIACGLYCDACQEHARLHNVMVQHTVSNKAQRQALECFIPAGKVQVDAVDGQPQKLVVLFRSRCICQQSACWVRSGPQHGDGRQRTSCRRMEQAMYPTCLSLYLQAHAFIWASNTVAAPTHAHKQLPSHSLG